MQKILNVSQIQRADTLTLERSGITHLALMERAANAFVRAVKDDIPSDSQLYVFCGPGNNGGDGLAIARIFQELDCDVICYYLDLGKMTDSCRSNYKRLQHVKNITEADRLPDIKRGAIVIDAIFGSGLSRPISGWPALVIKKINKSAVHVIAVDIPSGLYADKPSDGVIIEADRTVTFGAPKLSFFMKGYGDYVGDWLVADIGWDSEYLDEASSPYYGLSDTPTERIKPRKRFSHKGDYGHVRLIAGSYGKIGAAILAARACLEYGVGLISCHVPKCGYEIMQTAVPRAMCTVDEQYEVISDIAYDASKVYAVGPGLGTHPLTVSAIEVFIKKCKHPLVIDADGLNCIAKSRFIMGQLPTNSILTPHIGEFDRLFGASRHSFERLDRLREAAKRYQVIIVLKGAYTAICDAQGIVYFNYTGSPSLAQAGSGDILTGMIAAFLAQGYQAIEAAWLGVYFHGKRADHKPDYLPD